MGKFKVGDKVRYLGDEVAKDSSYSSAYYYAKQDGLVVDKVYTVLDVDTPDEVHLAHGTYWYSDDIFELVTPEEEYNDHDKHVVDALNSDGSFTCTTPDCKHCAYNEHEDISNVDLDNLEVIFEKDYHFYAQLSNLIKYLASTYGDKYEASEPNGFNPKELLTPDVCMFNVSKYLKRYSTKGYSKSGNEQDVLKSIHYLLISLNSVK